MHRGGGLALVVASLLALAACGRTAPTTTTTTDTTTVTTTTTAVEQNPTGDVESTYTGDGPRVAVLGDSLTVGSRSALRARLSNRSVRIAALWGEGLTGGPWSRELGAQVMLAAAEDIADDGAEVVVLALGTNDVVRDELDVEGAVASTGTYGDLLADSCVVVVTVNVDPEAPEPQRRDAEAVNVALRAIADEVADWDAIAEDPGLLRDDRIHPSAAGQREWATIVGDAVDGCERGG